MKDWTLNAVERNNGAVIMIYARGAGDLAYRRQKICYRTKRPESGGGVEGEEGENKENARDPGWARMQEQIVRELGHEIA